VEFRYRIDSKSLRGGGAAHIPIYSAHTFAAWQGTTLTECRRRTVIIRRCLHRPAQVQGFPEQLPLLTQGKAGRSASEAAVEQVVTDAELVVHEGRVVIQDIAVNRSWVWSSHEAPGTSSV
jgi:hypothetical protein